MKKPAIYYFTAFICGAAVMTAEMSASRLMAPYFGSSLYTWTNIVGLVMIALALGAVMGGKLADKNSSPKTYFTIILLTGVWIVLIPFFAEIVFKLIINLLPSQMAVSGSFFGILVLMFVPLVLLGMVVPFTMKLVAKDMKNIATVLGKVSALSTFGSIIGTFLPAFLLIPFLGTTKTFVLVGIILIFNAAIGLSAFFLLGILSLGLFFIVPPVFANDKIIYTEDSPYHFIFIEEAGEGRHYLMLDNPFGVHSKYDPAQLVLHDYISYMAALTSNVEAPKRALILGNASGSLSRIINTLYPEIKVTAIEIDPAITEVSRKYMGLTDSGTEIIHSDARAFLINDTNKYDLVFMDTFNALDIPVHLTSQEFFGLVKDHMSDDGLLGINVVSFDDSFLMGLANTVSTNFSNVSYAKVNSTENYILIAGNKESFTADSVPEELSYESQVMALTGKIFSQDSTIPIFTDDKTIAELLSARNSMEFYAKHLGQ